MANLGLRLPDCHRSAAAYMLRPTNPWLVPFGIGADHRIWSGAAGRHGSIWLVGWLVDYNDLDVCLVLLAR